MNFCETFLEYLGRTNKVLHRAMYKQVQYQLHTLNMYLLFMYLFFLCLQKPSSMSLSNKFTRIRYTLNFVCIWQCIFAVVIYYLQLQCIFATVIAYCLQLYLQDDNDNYHVQNYLSVLWSRVVQGKTNIYTNRVLHRHHHHQHIYFNVCFPWLHRLIGFF